MPSVSLSNVYCTKNDAHGFLSSWRLFAAIAGFRELGKKRVGLWLDPHLREPIEVKGVPFRRHGGADGCLLFSIMAWLVVLRKRFLQSMLPVSGACFLGRCFLMVRQLGLVIDSFATKRV
ncbi:unnamed protein product [Ectocarpus sp. 12 AP-2014]